MLQSTNSATKLTIPLSGINDEAYDKGSAASPRLPPLPVTASPSLFLLRLCCSSLNVAVMDKVIAITDCGFPSACEEERVAANAGVELQIFQCKTPEEVIAHARHADALINQHVYLTREVIQNLDRCTAIVRYGIGVDNIDMEAATEAGISVCNVPDYGVGEVAEHALAMALALTRQLPQTEKRFRSGEWSYQTPEPIRAVEDMTFATAGFGRIAQSLHKKISGLDFHPIAYDPFLGPEVFQQTGVESVGLDELFDRADILSLHLPLTEETRHFVDEHRLRQMHSTSIIVNTARGRLVDTVALAQALGSGEIAAAGIDVFEDEPPPTDHPIFRAPNTILTSHNAWYSESSMIRLQRMAAEEAVRAVRGEPLRNCLNRNQ